MTQHRLARVQLINWGTFRSHWSFQVPWKGILLTGPSGAGKSSLLDAMAAILVRPSKLRLNAAAQGTDTGDQGRSLVTYVRGAHKREADGETGEVGTAFLRPGPTWSAVGLTYTDEAGRRTTLLRLFHISGSSTDAADLKSVYAIAPGDVDLQTLKEFAANGIEVRRLKASFPAWDAYTSSGYTGFSERFRRLLGLGSEQAQVLLHKTQSAKNLTNLDSLFRDFMLDEPGTFALATETINQFDQLRGAHAAVVDARLQVEALAPLRDCDGVLRGLAAEAAEVAAERAHLDTWLGTRRAEALTAALSAGRPRLAALTAELAAAVAAVESAEAERQLAQRAYDQSGGADIGQLEDQRRFWLDAQESVARERLRYAAHADRLALELPADRASASDFDSQLRNAHGQYAARRQAFDVEQRSLMESQAEARRALSRAERDLEALRLHRSNLDPKLLALRAALADLLNVDRSRLPFVGELVQVRAEEGHWTGAIERVLGSFSRTLVVPEQHYLAAAEYIDGQYLGARLVYEKVGAEDAAGPADRDLVPGTLPEKVEIAAGPYASWVADRLQRRFAYACVDRAADFSHHDRAVTLQGQVKHSATLHEKDDRRRVGDRSRWVMGFSTEAKERELERIVAEAEAVVGEHEARLQSLDATRSDLDQVRDALDALAGVEWDRIDPGPAGRHLAELDARLDQLRELHRDIGALEAALKHATESKRAADAVAQRLGVTHAALEEQQRRSQEELDRLVAELAGADELPEDVARRLDGRAVGLDEAGLGREIANQLHERESRLGRRVSSVENDVIRHMGEYRSHWKSQAADWGQSREYLPEYLRRLDALVDDGLPKFESRFFDLLANQARNNIGQLAMQIRNARAEVRSRVDEVNKSLMMTPYGRETYLQIRVLTRPHPDVDRFQRVLHDITESSMLGVGPADTPAEREAAEARFLQMEDLLKRLGSAEPADQRWRDRCLDTRQHVQFQAQVVDADGAQLDVFTGSGGRSGGERQKLVTFCLAAALRFQLAPEGEPVPRYALVVIDEAFDKADHDFTQAGLEVFRTFGFQLLLATPMKMLQTIEDYVGGVVMVSNNADQGSVLQELLYDTDLPGLPAADEAQQEVLI